MDGLEHMIDQSRGQSDALRQAIFKRAFEGNLVPQDPDDPASVLLERIREEQTVAPKPKRGTHKAEGPV